MRALLCTLACLISLILPFSAIAQPDTVWTARYWDTTVSPSINPAFYGATELNSGDFILVGTSDPNQSQSNALIARISVSGDFLWTRVIGNSNGTETAMAAVQTNDSTIVVVGHFGYTTTPSMIALWGFSVDGDSLWYMPINGQGWTQGNDIQLLPDGNLLITGYKLGLDGQHSDMWIIKCTAEGDTVWTRLLGGNDTDIGLQGLSAGNNRLFFGGASKTMSAGDYDVWVLVTDSAGNQVSSELAGTSMIERCYGIGIGDNSVYLAGRQGALTSANNDGYLVKAEWNGNVLWSQAFSIGQTEEQFRDVAGRIDGGARCVGWAGTSSGDPQPWIADITSTGTLDQSWTNTEVTQGQFYGILPISTGGFLIFGTVVDGNQRKGYIIRTGTVGGISGQVSEVETGDPISGVRVGVVGSQRYALTNAQGQFVLELLPGDYELTVSGPCITADTVGTYTAVADTTIAVSLSAAMPRYQVLQSSINLLVYNRVPSDGPFTVYNAGSGELTFALNTEVITPAYEWLSVEPPAGVIPPHDSLTVQLIVNANGPDDGVYDYYGLLHVHAHSCPDSVDELPILVTVLDVREKNSVLPTEFALNTAYPNPFNATTRLSYSLPRDASVRLNVYDINGRQVQTLVDGNRTAGTYHLTFNGSGLPSGVYLIRMEAASFAATQKLMLLK